MKYKKSLLFICLIICLFSIASVCASDVNETVVASEDQSDVVSVEETTDEVVSVEDNATDDVVSVEETTDDIITIYDDQIVNDEVTALENVDDDLISINNEELISDEWDYWDYDDYNYENDEKTYPDIYLYDLNTYYEASFTDGYLQYGWENGDFDGKLVIYKGSSVVYTKILKGYDKEYEWYLENNNGRPVSTGSYVAKIIASDGTILKTAKIKISKAPTDLLVDSKTTKVGKKVTIKNIVMDDCGRAYTAKGKITLKINGKTYSANVKNGKFSISFKAPSKAKKYTCKITYSGDSNYKRSSYKFNVIVKASAKKKSTKKATTKKKTIKKKSNGKKITLKLTKPEKTTSKTIKGNHIYAFYKYRNQGQYGRGVCVDSYGKYGPGTLKGIKLTKAKIYFKNDYNGKTKVKTKKFDKYGYTRSNLINGYTPYKVIVFYK